jgi:hypothetical protein
MPIFLEHNEVAAWYRGANLIRAKEYGYTVLPESKQQSLGTPRFLPGVLVTVTIKCPFDDKQPNWLGKGTVVAIYRADDKGLPLYTLNMEYGRTYQTYEFNLSR